MISECASLDILALVYSRDHDLYNDQTVSILVAFSSISSKQIKPDLQNIHGLLAYHFSQQTLQDSSNRKNGTEPLSQKINFCIGNYMHFIAPF